MKSWIPNQHGAWAMLIAPIVSMMLSTGFHFMQLLLILGWLSAYCFNHYLGLTIKSWRRKDRWTRYRKQQLAYGLIALIIGWSIIVENIALLNLAPVFIFVFAVNLIAIKQGEERNWINDLLGIALSILVGGITAYVITGSIDSEQIFVLLALAIYFIGTVWYVKTIIREKGKAGWFWLSVIWHLGATVYGFSQNYLLGIFFLLTCIRAYLIPARNWSPKKVGILEIFFTTALLIITSF